MATRIAQRDLRNDSGAILRRVEDGEEFVVTRNGTPVAELRPISHRRAVPRTRLQAVFAGVPSIDLDVLRADSDDVIDAALYDPWQQRERSACGHTHCRAVRHVCRGRPRCPTRSP